MWRPLWYYLLDICAVNSYLIWRQNAQDRKKRGQRQFREPLIKALLNTTYPKVHISTNSGLQGNTASLANQNAQIHRWEDFMKRSYCVWCKDNAEKWVPKWTRPVLAEIVNGAASTQRKRQSKTFGGCTACNVYLCRKGACFEQYHSNSNVK